MPATKSSSRIVAPSMKILTCSPIQQQRQEESPSLYMHPIIVCTHQRRSGKLIEEDPVDIRRTIRDTGRLRRRHPKTISPVLLLLVILVIYCDRAEHATREVPVRWPQVILFFGCGWKVPFQP